MKRLPAPARSRPSLAGLARALGAAAASLLAATAAGATGAGTMAPPTPALAGDGDALLRDAASRAAPAGARVEVKPGTLDPRLRLAPCQRIEPYLPSGARPWGRTRVGLRCRDGQAHWNVFLPVTVRVFAPTWVATQPLPAGTVLEDTHFTRAEVDWAAADAPPLARLEALRGRTLARPLAAGQAPRGPDLRARQWFAAGETVSILAIGNGFAVSGQGQAMAPGIEGQPVRVKTDSGRIVTGQPVAERRIEVVL